VTKQVNYANLNSKFKALAAAKTFQFQISFYFIFFIQEAKTEKRIAVNICKKENFISI